MFEFKKRCFLKLLAFFSWRTMGRVYWNFNMWARQENLFAKEYVKEKFVKVMHQR